MRLTRHLSLRPADLLGEVDRLFRTGGALPRLSGNVPRDFSLYEAEDAWVLRTDLPGYRKEDLGLEVRDGVLTLTGSENAEHFTTSFERSLRLPKGVKREGISARLDHGVLELTLPKEAPAEPEALQIDIN